jgi:hypothetical protein
MTHLVLANVNGDMKIKSLMNLKTLEIKDSTMENIIEFFLPIIINYPKKIIVHLKNFEEFNKFTFSQIIEEIQLIYENIKLTRDQLKHISSNFENRSVIYNYKKLMVKDTTNIVKIIDNEHKMEESLMHGFQSKVSQLMKKESSIKMKVKTTEDYKNLKDDEEFSNLKKINISPDVKSFEKLKHIPDGVHLVYKCSSLEDLKKFMDPQIMKNNRFSKVEIQFTYFVGFFKLKKILPNIEIQKEMNIIGRCNSMGFEISFETVYDLFTEEKIEDNYHNGMVSLHFGEIEEAKKYFKAPPNDIDCEISLMSINK